MQLLPSKCDIGLKMVAPGKIVFSVRKAINCLIEVSAVTGLWSSCVCIMSLFLFFEGFLCVLGQFL